VQTRDFKTDHREDIFDRYSQRKDLPVLLLYNLNPEWMPEEIAETREYAHVLSSALGAEGHPVREVCLEDQDLEGLLRSYLPERAVVLNWCEEIPGIPHSYDLIARILEEHGFTFTGADSKALAFNQDKRLVKQRLTSLGIPTPKWKIFNSASREDWNTYPAIVKPALDHCSIGVTREAVVWTGDELAVRVAYVLETYHEPALVEQFIDGREFHVTVVGNGRLHVLPPAEMDFSAFPEARDRLCTYESKFDPQSPAYNLIKLHLPAELTAGEQARLTQAALQGYRAADCRDYARLDIRLSDGIFTILDINPNADISPDTTTAMSAELAGLPYGKFGSLLVNLAAQRHPVFRAMLQEQLVVE
jgi:D-alanine-D-alanine ligase